MARQKMDDVFLQLNPFCQVFGEMLSVPAFGAFATWLWVPSALGVNLHEG